jgi:diacylglycerol O-acyltransferase
MSPDRLSPLDASFLHIEDDVSHMHIASVAIFEGPPPPFADIVAMVDAKLDLVPRYRQKVKFVPFELGRPVWVDDPHFNIEYHLRHTALPSPGGESELRKLVGRVMSQQLDRSKPLWEIWVVEGLEDGRWAMLAKTHHAMVDGISGTDLLAVIMDLAPTPVRPEPHGGRPVPTPSGDSSWLDALENVVRRPTSSSGRPGPPPGPCAMAGHVLPRSGRAWWPWPAWCGPPRSPASTARSGPTGVTPGPPPRSTT